MKFVCPMHPEETSGKPGRCTKCGMELVKENELKSQTHGGHETKTSFKDYAPLAIVLGLIFLTALVLAFKDAQLGLFTIQKTISYFMIGFFLVFAGFKLIDLKGFAQGYSTYDLLAQRVFAYGYVYPFIELFFGLAMIIFSENALLLITEFLVMAFSGLGVTIKLLKRENFHCVCLGTFLKVPLTKITLVEDFGMAFLALILLFL